MEPDLRCSNRKKAASARPRSRHGLATAIALSLVLTGITNAHAQSTDPEEWRTDEFLADWGLGAIGAEYAYARGLTGKGVRLGIFDSGTGLDHPEFAGKDNRSLIIGDLLADGSRCALTQRLGGPNACFASEGGAPSFEYTYFAPDLDPRWVSILPYFGFKPGMSFQTHGTHVAGTMVANRDGNGTHGVAFGADLSAAKLFSDSFVGFLRGATGTGFRMKRLSGGAADSTAFDDMYAQMGAQGVRALNHSWGLSREPDTPVKLDQMLNDPDFAPELDAIANGSLKYNIIQVWAAGNTRTIVPNPANAPIAGLFASLPRARPELEPYWVSVVNLNKNLTLSNRSHACGLSANWCIAAPGTAITSTVYGDDSRWEGQVTINPDGSVELRTDVLEPTYEYANMSGTSMAAPHVSGALGLLFERFPYLSNAQVRDVMLTTATDLGAPGVDEVYGWGLLNLRKAIDGPGQLRVDTEVVMDRMAGGRKVWSGDAWDDWSNDIGGPGHLTKSGPGWLRLSGENSFGGATVRSGLLELTRDNRLGTVTVDGGILDLSGKLIGTDLTVQSGLAMVNGRVTGGQTRVGPNGILSGGGVLGDTRVEGVIAPGNSIGTLRVEGDYVQAAGSTYLAEVQPPSSADMLYITGQAQLQGGTLKIVRQPGVYSLGQRFQVMQVEGVLTGQFERIDQTAMSPFLKFTTLYGDHSLNVDVSRGESLASYAGTANQRTTGTAADRLHIYQGLPQRLTEMFPRAAMAALDQLSGDVYPTTQAILIISASHVRDSALARARIGQEQFTAQFDDDKRYGAWVELLRMGGTLDGNANAAGARYDGYTNLVGMDYGFDSGWRIGAMGGVGRTDATMTARNARARINARELGIYAGKHWGGLGLRGGYAMSWQDVDISRRVVFAGLDESFATNQDARLQQAFIEAGYRMGQGTWQWEPVVQLTRLRASGESLNERTNMASLRGRVNTADVNIASVGMRFDVSLNGAQQEQSWLNLRGAVNYQRTSGDDVTSARVAWPQGDVFTVQGAPLARNATRVDLGIAARTSRNSLLTLGYQGQYASQARQHSVNMRWALQF